jgi:integrase
MEEHALCFCEGRDPGMARGYTKQQAKSIETIHKVFEAARKMGVSIADPSGRVAHRSIENYEKYTRAVFNKACEQFGIERFTELTPGMTKEILLSYTNPWTMKAYAHGLFYFQEALVKTKAVYNPPKIIDKVDVLQTFKELGVVRHSGDSTVLRATDSDVEKVLNEIRSSNFSVREQAEIVVNVARYTGARLEGVFNMRAGDIELREDGTAVVRLDEKGAKVRYVQVWDRKAVAYLTELKGRCRKDTSPILRPVRDQKGRIRNRKEVERKIQACIKKCAERAGVNRDGRDFSAHSARKAFAQSRMDHYAQMEEKELKVLLNERVKADPKLAKKIKIALHRINHKGHGKRRTKSDRGFNHRELCVFLVSLDTGHSRIDVVTMYYASYRDLRGVAKRVA